MPAVTSRSRGIAAMIVALVIVGAITDIALRLLAPVPSPYAKYDDFRPQINQYIRVEYPRNYATETSTEDELPGMKPRNKFTINNMGFRGPTLESPKPPEEFRIFVVGGSTTECFYLDDEDEMCRVAERALRASPQGQHGTIYNVGLSGSASDDHLAMIGQRLVHLEPDMIVLFCGINDLTRSIYNIDYLHYIEERPVTRKPWIKRILMVSQIGRRLYYLKQRIDPSDPDVLEWRPLKSDYLGKIGLQRTVATVDTPPHTNIAGYTRNLKSIIGITEALGVQLVLMTHPSTWNSSVDPEMKKWSWMRHRNGVTYREDLMDAALESLNDAMRGLADEYGVPLYDMSRAIPRSTEFYYDDCHFNVKGADMAGNGLAGFLLEQSLLSRGGSE